MLTSAHIKNNDFPHGQLSYNWLIRKKGLLKLALTWPCLPGNRQSPFQQANRHTSHIRPTIAYFSYTELERQLVHRMDWMYLLHLNNYYIWPYLKGSSTALAGENVGNNNKANAIELASQLTVCLASTVQYSCAICFHNNSLCSHTVKWQLYSDLKPKTQWARRLFIKLK